ncbi:hypothetical protein PED39_04710 [Methanomassiliicoccales archaeon LGM-RCC1]|nr:hypothetical protein PED39_04710 [Methanomassiliicoccales archaeon LGM-RCC1]
MSARNTKFLAVLAVFVMAFSVITVIATSEQNDAANTEETTSDLTINAIDTSVTLTGNGAYYYADNGDTVSAGSDGDYSVTVFVRHGASVTFASKSTHSITVTAYVAATASDSWISGQVTYYKDTKLEFVVAAGGVYTQTITASNNAGNTDHFSITTMDEHTTLKTPYKKDGTTYTFLTDGSKTAYYNEQLIVFPVGSMGTYTVSSLTYSNGTAGTTAVATATVRAATASTGVITFSIGTAATGTMVIGITEAASSMGFTMDKGVATMTAGELNYGFMTTNVSINFYATKAVQVASNSPLNDGNVTISSTSAGIEAAAAAPFIYGKVEAGRFSNAGITATLNNATAHITLNNLNGTGDVINSNKAYVEEYTGTLTISETGTAIVSTSYTRISLESGTFTVANNFHVYENDYINISADSRLVMGENFLVDKATSLGASSGRMIVKGGLDSSAASTALKCSGTFKAHKGMWMSSKVKVDDQNGTGTIDFTEALSRMGIGGTMMGGATFHQTQSVDLISDLTIRNNSVVTVWGTLTIPEGMTLTIDQGSTLIIDSDSAILDVKGDIEVKDGAYLRVYNLESSSVTGSIEGWRGSNIILGAEDTVTASGPLSIANGGSLESQGNLDLYAYNNVGVSLKTSAGSKVVIEGTFSAESKSTSIGGKLILDDAYMGLSSELVLATTGAEADVREVTIARQTSASTSAVLTIKDGVNTFTVASHDGSTDGIDDRTGLEGIKLTVASGTTSRGMDISGHMDYVLPNGSNDYPVVTISGSTPMVKEDLYLGDKVVLNVAANKLAVSGNLYVLSSDARLSVTGKVASTGLITLRTNVDTPTNMIGAYYKPDDLSSIYHYYTTLEKAMDAGATAITIYGAYALNSNLYVPSTVELSNRGDVTIGSRTNTSAVVKFADGAVFRGNGVTVYGTLEFENKDDNRLAHVNCDVAVEGEVSSIYTNVYNALNNANPGDTVTITSTETVTFRSNVTVKEGVTLAAPYKTQLALGPRTVITIDGTVTAFNGIAGTFDGSSPSELVVNGVFMTGESDNPATIYAKYKVAAMYYCVYDRGPYVNVTPLRTASIDVMDAEDATIFAYGAVDGGAVSVMGKSADEPATIIVAEGSSLTADITAANARLVALGTFDGTISNGTNVAEIKGIRGFTATFDSGLILSGSVTKGAKSKTPVITLTDGTVTATGLTVPETVGFEVNAGSALAIAGKVSIYTMTVDGTVIVNSGKNPASENKSTSAGSLTVVSATILGSLVVLPADNTNGESHGGSLTVTSLYIGMESDDLSATAIASARSIGFADDAGIIYLRAGSTISDDAVTDMKASRFYVDGELYMTVYVPGDSTCTEADIGRPTVEDSIAGKWMLDGEEVDTVDLTMGKDYELNVNHKIYYVTIVTDSGLKSVSIDGILLLNTGGNVFVSTKMLEAGTYEVTYTLMKKYEETASGVQLSDRHGNVLEDRKFVLSGTDGYDDEKGYALRTFQLSGTEPISPEPVEPEKESELTITNLLLSLLFVILSIMAIYLALSLDRR